MIFARKIQSLFLLLGSRVPLFDRRDSSNWTVQHLY